MAYLMCEGRASCYGQYRRIPMKNSNFEEAHEINNAIDDMISERQFVDTCQYDDREETFRLVSLGSEFKKAGKDWYRWAKATAIRLWESGHIVK